MAVGWLDARHSFSVGRAGAPFEDRLFEACRSHATARTRGWHRCELCAAEGDPRETPITVTRGEESLAVGDAEIRAISSDGTWLIAPTLVVHYVVEHRYLPPPTFVEAVMRGSFITDK